MRRFLEDFLKFLYRTLESIHGPEDNSITGQGYQELTARGSELELLESAPPEFHVFEAIGSRRSCRSHSYRFGLRPSADQS